MNLLKDTDKTINKIQGEIVILAGSVLEDIRTDSPNSNSLGIFLDRVESQYQKLKTNPNSLEKVAHTLAVLYMQDVKKTSPKLTQIIARAAEFSIDGMSKAVDELQISRDSVDKVKTRLIADMNSEGKATAHIINVLRKKFIVSNL